MDSIQLRGARTHNLKNIDLDIPRDRLVVITGLSGSGKSSLAFDTLYAEGQRRYVESLSTYARQFLSMMEKPDIDHVEGLSPAISIEQKSTSHNPRSTVGTITEIYDYLRLLFARVGTPHCPEHAHPLQAQTVSQMVDAVLALPEGCKLMLLAPVVRDRKGEHLHVFEELRGAGFVRARVDGHVRDLDDLPSLDKKKKHTIEVVVDRFKVRDDIGLRLAESFETALGLTDGLALVVDMDGELPDHQFSARFACPECGHSINELEPRLFSFNNPAGACPGCDGLGVRQFFDPERIVLYPEASLAEGAIRGWDRRNVYYFHLLTSLAEHYGFDIDTPFRKLRKKHRDIILHGSGDEEISFSYVNDRGTVFQRRHHFEGILPNMERRYRDTESQSVREDLAKFLSTAPCSDCGGSRLCEDARHVLVDGRNLPAITALPVGEAETYFENLALAGRDARIADKILKEIRARYRFLVDVGLNYLTLERSAETLSGGEAQRIRLASQIGAGLVGVMYILDEPSIGLHQRDNERLLRTLTHLRDLGNTVLVVEHDEDAIRSADHIIDIGPGAGVHGGTIVAQGEPRGDHGRGALPDRRLPLGATQHPDPGTAPRARRWPPAATARRQGQQPANASTWPSLSASDLRHRRVRLGKVHADQRHALPPGRHGPQRRHTLTAAAHESIEGLEHIDKCIDIDQSPIGRTPRSNPATYTGIFTPIRELFAGPRRRARAATSPGASASTSRAGAARPARATASPRWRCTSCRTSTCPAISARASATTARPWIYATRAQHPRGPGNDRRGRAGVLRSRAGDRAQAPDADGRRLSYVRLGQAATTLSGGEAQRVKLSRELSKRDTGRTLYILDEPTTGLHFEDIRQLLGVLHRLRDRGNTVVIIEHNLDVIKTADWIVDLGPEGGSGGGEIIATGTPEDVASRPRTRDASWPDARQEHKVASWRRYWKRRRHQRGKRGQGKKLGGSGNTCSSSRAA
jgi:excinuclease ABC subunit A